jgi:hypothetical protein
MIQILLPALIAGLIVSVIGLFFARRERKMYRASQSHDSPRAAAPR